ncbi:trimeric intracellular cation channel family protein [Prevotella sp. tf2-5]|jgi:uncharacterized membrane protein YeiH|uniref:trimeric intracellular cation channel family protein n=1 Tax=Prevotella sp. tf2-5 TaxID=1761889 RepID=UPI0008EF2D70|nr:trimeric intracellular cation channel family protein [Prevotella sp. tf2-5]SFO95250.1 Uncharacterized membrane protein YeiH [Prevotella sp. tf2-5]
MEYNEIVTQVIEFLGTFAFAISGIRHAAAKHFDWFGGYVCGIAVAIGGGTIRDVMLGTTPFWMTNPIYMICTAFALIFVIIFSKHMEGLRNTWFFFDTLGLALFTIAGIQKSLLFGHPYWVGIIMGCITGSAGGVIRDVLLNNEPVIFHKEIYAMAAILGGITYWILDILHLPIEITVISSFCVTCLIRFLAVKYHLSLPTLKNE